MSEKIWRKAVISPNYVKLEDENRDLIFHYDAVEVIREVHEIEGLRYIVHIHHRGIKYTVLADRVEFNEHNVLTSFFLRATLDIRPEELKKLSTYIIEEYEDVLAVGRNWVLHGRLVEDKQPIHYECIRLSQLDIQPKGLGDYVIPIVDTAVDFDIEKTHEDDEEICYRINAIRKYYDVRVGVVVDPAKKELIDREMLRLVLRRGDIELLRPM